MQWTCVHCNNLSVFEVEYFFPYSYKTFFFHPILPKSPNIFVLHVIISLPSLYLCCLYGLLTTVKLSWLFLVAPLTFTGAPVNIQGNIQGSLDRYDSNLLLSNILLLRACCAIGHSYRCLGQDCSISIANTLEILQFCIKPLICIPTFTSSL